MKGRVGQAGAARDGAGGDIFSLWRRPRGDFTTPAVKCVLNGAMSSVEIVVASAQSMVARC
ncbi:hypothetical protein J2Y55_004327 [Bosea sp. BE125]|uniref:hypothetical protein n=1 Tax=Bosea sp. BE125 TaxID=2817909 RepID=UPI0028582C00|nr:hypothetical protein [Bosea sp. BE125]MDR6873303.1 hypothetical protein [Bosea sp. BE125]